MLTMITSEEYKELIIKANKYDELQNANTKEENTDLEVKFEKLEGEDAKKIY